MGCIVLENQDGPAFQKLRLGCTHPYIAILSNKFHFKVTCKMDQILPIMREILICVLVELYFSI